MGMGKYPYKWFFLAVLSLGLGGGFAFLVAMSRTPFGYRFFPPDYMYHALAGHVVLAILLWLLSFTVVLWSRYFKGVEWKYSYMISLSGIILVTLSVLTSKGAAVPNNYVPTIVDPMFFTGLSLFFLGFSINVLGYLKEALRHLRSQDILLNTISVSVLISFVMIAAMLYSLLVNHEAAEPFLYYERLFWTAGHIQQILNGAILVSVWYALLRILEGQGKSWGFLRHANFILLLSSVFLFGVQIFVDPVERISRIAAELIYTIGLGLPVFLHIANILKSLRRKNRGVAYIALTLSVAIYIAGVAIAYSGFGNDLRVPAHYHGAVTSLTLALMGFSYYLIREITYKVYGERIARVQPVIYGAGMLLFILGLFISGAFGAPRKTYGVAFTSDPIILSALTVMGVGTILAVTGGILFVAYIAMSLLKVQRG